MCYIELTYTSKLFLQMRQEHRLNQAEIVRVQQYLREKFGTEKFILRAGPQEDSSVEVSLGNEFIGVVFKDEDEGEISYDFHMTILEMDLPE